MSVAITVNTSTSYLESLKISAVDLYEFYDDLLYYFEEMKKQRNKNNK